MSGLYDSNLQVWKIIVIWCNDFESLKTSLYIEWLMMFLKLVIKVKQGAQKVVEWLINICDMGLWDSVLKLTRGSCICVIEIEGEK